MFLVRLCLDGHLICLFAGYFRIGNNTQISFQKRLMTEEEIIQGMREGGKHLEESAKAFYKGFCGHMSRFFVHQGATTSEAEDIFQETVIKAIDGSSTFSAIPGSGKPWLWAVARNTFNDYMRRKSRGSTLITQVDNDLIEAVADPLGDKLPSKYETVDDCVDQGIQKFAQVQPERAYVLQLQLEKVSIEEIAVQIGRTAMATKSYLYESRGKLKPYVEECWEMVTS